MGIRFIFFWVTFQKPVFLKRRFGIPKNLFDRMGKYLRGNQRDKNVSKTKKRIEEGSQRNVLTKIWAIFQRKNFMFWEILILLTKIIKKSKRKILNQTKKLLYVE